MRDRDIAVDHHAFELVEGVLVRRVDLFVAKRAAGRDHAQRRTEPLHSADLHRRGVRAQQIAVGKPEGVLHIARGMLRRDIEGVEIVILGLDLGTIENREAE